MIKFFKWVLVPKSEWEYVNSRLDEIKMIKTKYTECRESNRDLRFEVSELQNKVRVRESETMKYKVLYLDEQAKRLSLAKRVRELESNG